LHRANQIHGTDSSPVTLPKIHLFEQNVPHGLGQAQLGQVTDLLGPVSNPQRNGQLNARLPERNGPLRRQTGRQTAQTHPNQPQRVK